MRKNKQAKSLLYTYGTGSLVFRMGVCRYLVQNKSSFVPIFLYVLDDILNLESQAPMEIIKEKTIAFTGNRSLTSPSGLHGIQLEQAICDKLYDLLEREYLENGITFYLSGVAIGYDTLAAMVVLELKRKYPSISLIAVIPFEGQDAKFSPQQRQQYSEILKQADHSITISQYGYSNEAYHERNDFLISNAIKMYGYHNGKPRSGTGSTMRKAGERGVEVINLYESM